MKDQILLALAARWDADAAPKLPSNPGEAVLAHEDDVPGARARGIADGRLAGQRETKRECADAIRTLVQLLGDRP